MSDGVEFGLLGSFEVRVGGRQVLIRSPKFRIILAALLLEPGRLVPVDRLIEAAWGPDKPDKPRRTLQLHVTRLRALLVDAGAPPVIVTGADGYRADLPSESVDLGQFSHWLDEADAAAERSEPDAESAALARALALWRGEPLVDVPSEALHRRYLPGLAEQHLRTIERHVDVRLGLGRHLDVLAELGRLTSEHPLRERLWVQLMTALYRSGQRVEALNAYHRGSRHLSEELGVDPGRELQQLHATILTGASPTGDGPAALPAVPRQLPMEVTGFVGRDDVRARMLSVMEATDGPAGRPAILVVNGMGGVGKTALALHWSRHVADRFPDGQLWLDLHGYDPRPIVTPRHGLRSFLGALGVGDTDMPDDLESLAGLYRSVMDGRRMLIVLDNVSSTEQVRPLLPGSPGNLVLVTSRNELTGLVAVEGAHPVRLDPLTRIHARQMLGSRLGADRIDAEPDAVDRIIARCGGLPLALAIAAARAAARPGFTLTALDRQLAGAGAALDRFVCADATADVRGVFSWSYAGLTPPAARLFRLIGLHPSGNLSAAVAASLNDTSPGRTRQLVDELADAHLVTESSPDRLALHDLLHAYAVELTQAHDSVETRRAATHRILDHYLRTAHAAAELIEPLRDPISPAVPRAVEPGPHFADYGEAMDWLTMERGALLAVLQRATAHGFDVEACQLASCLVEFLERRGYWHDLVATQEVSIAAAGRLGSRPAEAWARLYLARAHRRLGRADDARHETEQAFHLYRGLGDVVGQARVHMLLGSLLEQRGDWRLVLDHDLTALDLLQTAGHRTGQAEALNAVGWDHAQLGEYRQTIDYCRASLRLCEELGSRTGAASAWDSLGYAHHCLDDCHRALVCYQIAVELRRSLGHRYGEAGTLMRMGDTYARIGDQDAARRAWLSALAILEHLGRLEAERIRARLRQFDPVPT